MASKEELEDAFRRMELELEKEAKTMEEAGESGESGEEATPLKGKEVEKSLLELQEGWLKLFKDGQSSILVREADLGLEDVKLEEIDPAVPYRPDCAHPNGGLRVTDEAATLRQRKIIWDFVKHVGVNLFAIKDIIHTSLPVQLFEPRSFIERMTDQWAYGPLFLTKAAKAKDPAERLKYVLAFVIAGSHRNCVLSKPFNPILGETFQAKYEDGSSIFCEQVSHHPPVSSYQFFGAKNLFQFYGLAEFCAQFRGNSVKGWQKGTNSIVFKDGGKVIFRLPTFIASGIMWGERVVEYVGQIQFHDPKNHIVCDIRFNPDAGGNVVTDWLKGSAGGGKRPSDFFSGEIYRYEHNKEDGQYVKLESFGDVEGSWIGYLNVKGERVWDIRREYHLAQKPTPVANPLPSDCRFREDMLLLAANDLEGSQRKKCELEEAQRADRELRKQGREKSG